MGNFPKEAGIGAYRTKGHPFDSGERHFDDEKCKRESIFAIHFLGRALRKRCLPHTKIDPIHTVKRRFSPANEGSDKPAQT